MRALPRGRYLIVFAILVMICLLLLTANIAETELGGKGSGQGAVEQLQGIVFPLALGVWTVLLIWFLLRSMKRKRGGPKGEREEPSSGLWGLIVVFVIIAAVVLISGPLKESMFTTEDNGLNDTMDQPLLPGENATESSKIVLVGALAAVLIAMLPLLFRYAKGRSISGDGRASILEDVQILETTIARVKVSTGDELRDAIILSYQQVLDMARARLKDADMLTPREIMEQSVHTLGWPSGAMEEMTRLFELARYSQHAIDAEERTSSKNCLESILSKVAGAKNDQ